MLMLPGVFGVLLLKIAYFLLSRLLVGLVRRVTPLFG